MLLRGARQVGKSTLVRLAARDLNVTLLEVNLERHLRLDAVFATLNLRTILDELEAILRVRIPTSGVILFLDEIQATPNALNALRYFLEDMPDLPVIAAGSLLDLVLAEHAPRMPVGRIQYLHIGPMTFEEFLLAKGENWLLDAMRSYTPGSTTTWSTATHEQGITLAREFMFVGGMPEAVAQYIEGGSAERHWIEAQQRIVDTYKDDFSKYTRHSAVIPVLQGVYDRLPAMIGKKLKYAKIAPDARTAYAREAMHLLRGARVINLTEHTDARGIPLAAEADNNICKPYWVDVGLLGGMLGIRWELTRFDEQFINEGPLAEQFVAQHMAYWHELTTPPQLYYWLREGRQGNAEVDFVVQMGHHIVPIEVKAGKSGSLKSLMQFVADRSLKFAIRFSLGKPELQQVAHDVPTSRGIRRAKYKLLNLPLYMVGETHRLAQVCASQGI